MDSNEQGLIKKLLDFYNGNEFDVIGKLADILNKPKSYCQKLLQEYKNNK